MSIDRRALLSTCAPIIAAAASYGSFSGIARARRLGDNFEQGEDLLDSEVVGAWTPECLGERLWLNFRSDDLADGPVADWLDHSYGITATQTEPALQPVKTGDFVHFENTKVAVPHSSRGGTAHKAMAMLFRTSGGTDRLLHINGFKTGPRYRQPAVSLDGARLTVHWADDGGQRDLTLPITIGEWHSLVTRRENGAYYASIDGSAEVSVKSDFVPSTSKQGTLGQIGSTLTWDLDQLVIIQLGMTQVEIDKFHGWTAHKRGIALPVGHPYESSPPPIEVTDWRSSYVETPLAEWQEQRTWIGTRELIESNLGDPIDLTEWILDFEDDFSIFSVRDQTDARPSNWYAAVHTAGAGDANVPRLGVNPPFYVQGNDELILEMARRVVEGGPTDGAWYGSVITSVNLAGHGRTWAPPYYMEARLRCRTGAPAGSWAAFWTESINYLNMQTEPYTELDICEHYASDPNGYHCVWHRHDPVRDWPLSDRIADDSHKSNYVRLNDTTPWGYLDLWDNQYHVYGCMVEDDWTKIYLDGKEISRAPTLIEWQYPVFILLDMALVGDERGSTANEGNEMGIDYVKVYTK